MDLLILHLPHYTPELQVMILIVRLERGDTLGFAVPHAVGICERLCVFVACPTSSQLADDNVRTPSSAGLRGKGGKCRRHDAHPREVMTASHRRCPFAYTPPPVVLRRFTWPLVPPSSGTLVIQCIRLAENGGRRRRRVKVESVVSEEVRCRPQLYARISRSRPAHDVAASPVAVEAAVLFCPHNSFTHSKLSYLLITRPRSPRSLREGDAVQTT